MQRETQKLLFDVLDAGQFILALIRDIDYARFCDDRLVRDAVERNFITIGEAMNRLRRREPDLIEALAEHPQVVAFRNIVVHAYDTIDHAVVWSVANQHLPDLLTKIEKAGAINIGFRSPPTCLVSSPPCPSH